MQVAAVIYLAVETVPNLHSEANNIIIQSENSSSFSSQKVIPLIFNMNTRLYDEIKLLLRRWIFIEAQTGITQLDTHFSFLNKKFKPMWRMNMICLLKIIFYGCKF